jgi:prevent-host-death family protein
MKYVNIHEAKTHLSQLLARVEKGEEIIIARDNKPIVRMVPQLSIKNRVPGTGKNRVHFKKGFEKPLPEDLIREFEA